MRRLLILLFVLLMISTPAAATTSRFDIQWELKIDNVIIYFDLMTSTPCFPYLVDDGNAYYCSQNKTIYYGNKLTTDYPRIVGYFILAHEDGHSSDPDIDDIEVSTFEKEQFADCWGGIGMKKLYLHKYIDLDDLQQLSDFVRTLPDGDHGTSVQRYAAFAEGYLHGNCEYV